MAQNNIWDWQNSPGTILIQNKNLISDTFISLMQQANAAEYNGKTTGGARLIAHSYVSPGNFRVPIYNPEKLPAGVCGYNTDGYLPQRSGNFGWTGCFSQTYNWKYGAYCLDYMPRLHVKLTPLSDYLVKLRDNSSASPVWVYSGNGVFVGQGSGIQWGFRYNEPVDYTTFIEQAGNFYVCEQLSFYTDKNDGTNQELLDSASIAYTFPTNGYQCKIDVAQPLNAKGFPNGNYEWYLLGYYSQFMGALKNGIMYPSIFDTIGLHAAMITGTNLLSPLWNPGAIQPATFSGWTSVPNSPYGAVHYATKKDWETLLNGGGCSWSYDLNIVISPNGNGLKRPATPGQPENPVDTGDGDGDNISDTIEYPQPEYIPNAYRRYWLTSPQVDSLKNFLFKGTFIDNVKRLWTEPGEYIVDLSYYPLNPQLLGFTGDSENISIGDISSGINAPVLPNNSRLTIFAGSVDINRYYNSYLDFDPYTSIDIFLPYIGVRGLNTSQIMGHKLLCAYYLDVNTLQITAALGLDGDMSMSGGSLGNVLTQYTSSFGVRFPLSGTAANQMILNVVQQVAGVVSGSAALIGGVATGNVAMAAGGAATGAGALLSGGQTSPITYGSISPMSGLYAPQLPYLIINRPISAEPSTWAADMGYSAGYSGKVSDFSGALTAQHVDLVRADEMSDDEANAIISALERGIII